MRMNIAVRKAERKDLESILSLNKALFDYESKFDHEYNLDWTYSEKGRSYFQKRLESDSSIILVAEADSTVVGYILLFIHVFAYRLHNPIAEIENMFVREDYRNQKLGTRLITEAKKIAAKRGVKRIRVAAMAKNADARRFYKSLGFDDFESILEIPLDKAATSS